MAVVAGDDFKRLRKLQTRHQLFGSRQLTLAEWERLGVHRVGNQPFARPSERAYLLVPAGVRGPGFLMLNNFRVIMKYNPAEAYALAIGHLADRMRGGDPIVQLSPPLIAGPEQFEEIESILRPVLTEASERMERWSSLSRA